jgi:copper resistance protein B
MDLDRVIRTFVLAEQLEVHANQPERPVDVELVSWIGGDYRRMFLRLQGEQSTRRSGGAEFQGDVLYGRLITPFWSAVAGARVDTRLRSDVVPVGVGNPSDQRQAGGRLTRGMLAIGFVGLAPGWFEVEPTLLVSDKGDVSLEVESSFDLLFTQRLIVQPWVEINAAVQAVPEIGVGSGLNDVEVGARMRYEIRRKFAPYVGVSLLRRTGVTAATTHNVGEQRSVGTIMAGLRIWR